MVFVGFFLSWLGTNSILAVGKQAVSSGWLHCGCGNLYLLLKVAQWMKTETEEELYILQITGNNQTIGEFMNSKTQKSSNSVCRCRHWRSWQTCGRRLKSDKELNQLLPQLHTTPFWQMLLPLKQQHLIRLEMNSWTFSFQPDLSG